MRKVSAVQRLTPARDKFEYLPYIGMLKNPTNTGFCLGKIALLPCCVQRNLGDALPKPPQATPVVTANRITASMVLARLLVWLWFEANSFSLLAHFAGFVELRERKKKRCPAFSQFK
jgi:hypothetical protein